MKTIITASALVLLFGLSSLYAQTSTSAPKTVSTTVAPQKASVQPGPSSTAAPKKDATTTTTATPVVNVLHVTP